MAFDMKAYMHEYFVSGYAFWKKLSRCVKCHGQDAYTLAGRVNCFACSEKEKQSKNKRDKSEKNKRARELYAKRKADGLCVKCGKVAQTDRTMCSSCLAKERIRNAKKRKPKILPRGLGGAICYKCNEQPVALGKRLCQQCYDKMLPISMANIAIVHERTRNDPDSYWMQENRAIWRLLKCKQ